MKKITLLITFIGFNFYLFGQSVVSVGGSEAFPADYVTLQGAIDSVAANSVIYVHAGTYGDVVMDKPLIIVGPGYFLAENPETQFNIGEASLSTLTINAGAENSMITGLFVNSAIFVHASNISISRNQIGSIQLLVPTIMNITITQNYIVGNGINKSGEHGPSEITIKNNYIASRIENISGVVENNVIGGWWADCSSFPKNTLFKNNIFIQPNPSPSGNNHPPVCLASSNNNTFLNNVCVWPVAVEINTSEGSGNLRNVPLDSLFTSDEPLSTDGQWQLSSTSPAVGAGLDGGDCGMFGGDEPYVLSGIPAGPHIYDLESEAVGASQGGLNVRIKVKISN